MSLLVRLSATIVVGAVVGFSMHAVPAVYNRFFGKGYTSPSADVADIALALQKMDMSDADRKTVFDKMCQLHLADRLKELPEEARETYRQEWTKAEAEFTVSMALGNTLRDNFLAGVKAEFYPKEDKPV